MKPSELTTQDLISIAQFNRVIKNYLKMKIIKDKTK
jgi:hypothetical protein